MDIRSLWMGLAAEISGQKDRIFLWIPVAFAVGIAIYFGLEAEPGVWAACVCAVAALPVAVWCHRRKHENALWLAAFLMSAGLFVAALGFGAAQTGTNFYGTPILVKSVGPIDAAGVIESAENLGEGQGSRVVLKDVVLEDMLAEDTPRKIRLKFRKDEGLKAGQTISALVKLDAPSMAVLPGAYDFRRHLFFQGIGAVGFAYTKATILNEKPRGGVSLFFEELRNSIDARIHKESGTVSAGIMSALITGSRGAIADQDDDAMRDSGLYHLLSISGTHVSMVAAVLFFSVRFLMACFPWVALHWPIKKIAAVTALMGAAFYVFLAGAEVPAQRSLLMTGLVMVAIILDRSPFSLRLIAFSALAVLLIAPHSLIGVSFQMSYAAVAALICFFDYIRPWWMKWRSRAGFLRKAAMYMMGLIMTSVIAGTITGMFSLYHFQTFAVYGVLSNMIAVPLTGVVIMPAAIAALILMPFGIDGWALHVMEWGTLWMLAVAHWTAGLDHAVIHVRQWPVETYFFIVTGMVLFLLWHGWRGKAVAVCAVMVGIVLTVFAPLPDIMVSQSGKLVAVRDDRGGLYFSSKRKDKFTASNWLRLAGKEKELPKGFLEEGSPLLCDGQGCRVVLKGRNVSIVRTQKGFREDCAWADLLIAEIPVKERHCPEKTAIYDLYDFRDDGAHAAFIAKSGEITMRSVRDETGNRPWSKKPHVKNQ